MHYKLLFPSLYIGHADLRGEDRTLTIRTVVMQDIESERGAERRPVMYFAETQKAAEKDGQPDKEKRLVLNKTNATTIASMHGNETDAWAGKRITLFPTQAQAFGKMTDCVRVRPEIPAEKPADKEPAAAKGGR